MIRLKNNYAITSSNGNYTLAEIVHKKNKDGIKVEIQKPLSYQASLESALRDYINYRMSDAINDNDMDLKDVKKTLEELKEEIKTYKEYNR